MGKDMTKTIAVAGVGAIGAAVCRALIDGIDGFELVAASALDPDASRALIDRPAFNLPFVPLEDIADRADWVVEALPASAVPALTHQTMAAGKTLVMITSAALLLNPELQGLAGQKGGRILVPSGALAALDGISALAGAGVHRASLTTTKAPKAYGGAPYVVANRIDLAAFTDAATIFTGNALEAAAAFPANVNVAATLTLATRLPPEAVRVEARADPAMTANRHEIVVEGEFSTLRLSIENKPDPANPKSSALAAMSIVSLLRRQNAPLAIG